MSPDALQPSNPSSFSLTSPATRWAWRAGAAAAAAVCVALAGCGGGGDQAKAGAAGGGAPAMPPVEVGVVSIDPGNVPVMAELPGRLEASRVAQVRARAAGILQKRLFTEGADVREGQQLFQIDPAPYKATLDSAQAALVKAEANLAQAAALVERYQPLQAAKAISPQDFLNAQVAQRQAQADVASAKASVATAKLNLGYASVTSPISGRIGRALVTEGALVGQGEVTQLAVVQQINPLYVNFTQSVNDAMRLRQALAAGKLQAAGKDAAVVKVVLDDGTEYPAAGKLLFTDLTVDSTSGQVTLRAELPNAKGLLLPGMYVRVRLAQAQVSGGALLPQQAVTRTAQGDFVSVVADGKIAKRLVKLGGATGTNWVVLDGLKAGEQVMVDGFQKVAMAPKAPIKPVPWSPLLPAAGAAPAAAASGAQPAASSASAAQ